MPANRRLDPADVLAMLSGTAANVAPLRDVCDRCNATDAKYLEFGGDSGFEMPVVPGSDLERGLDELREAKGRRTILLCYSCSDDLEEPPNGRPSWTWLRTKSAATVADESTPRLFEV